MWFVIIGFILFILQSFLILGTEIVIYPELYFFPWLVSKGFIPYRDFFDHHGFLLYYLFSPLTLDQSFLLLKLTYFLSHTTSLILLLLIFKKITTKLGFIIGGLLFVLTNFFVSENFLWYEAYIVTLYLVIYLILLLKEFRYKSAILGVIIAFSSFIKPVAALILLPVLIIKKDILIVVVFLLSWTIVFIYFFFNQALIQFFEYTLKFNSYLFINLNHGYSYWPKFTFFLILISVFSFLVISKLKKIKTLLFPIMLYFSSFIFISSNYFGEHFLPLVTFFSVIVTLTVKYIRGKIKLIYLGIITLFLVYLVKIDIQQHFKFNSSQRIPWQDDIRIKLILKELKNLNIGSKKIYIFSNHPEIYMYLNQLPPTYFSIYFPFAEKYFPDYENRIISELERHNVRYIVVPKPIEEYYLKKEFFKSKYSLLKDTDNYQIFSK